jgi:hypothetical protein
VVKRDPVEERRLRRAAGFFEPRPHVLSSLRAVAVHACGNDIIGLRKASLRDSDDMIPCCPRRWAIRAASRELFQDGFASRRRNWLDASLSERRALPPAESERGIAGVASPAIGVCAQSAFAGPDASQPLAAAGAPLQTFRRFGAPLYKVGTWGYALANSAGRANIPPSVKSGPIDHELIYRPRHPATAAHLFAPIPPGNEARIGRARVLRSAHGPSVSRLSQLGKKAAGRLLDGVEHNAFPAGAA